MKTRLADRSNSGLHYFDLIQGIPSTSNKNAQYTKGLVIVEIVAGSHSRDDPDVTRTCITSFNFSNRFIYNLINNGNKVTTL